MAQLANLGLCDGERLPEEDEHWTVPLLPEAASCAAAPSDVLILCAHLEGRAGVVNEDVIERRTDAEGDLEIRRRTERHHAPTMHDRDHLAEVVGLLHVVGGHENRRPELAAKVSEV